MVRPGYDIHDKVTIQDGAQCLSLAMLVRLSW
jgi:hypothetical protein